MFQKLVRLYLPQVHPFNIGMERNDLDRLNIVHEIFLSNWRYRWLHFILTMVVLSTIVLLSILRGILIGEDVFVKACQGYDIVLFH